MIMIENYIQLYQFHTFYYILKMLDLQTVFEAPTVLINTYR